MIEINLGEMLDQADDEAEIAAATKLVEGFGTKPKRREPDADTPPKPPRSDE